MQLEKSNNLPSTKGLVWKKQRGICPGCDQIMDPIQSNILDLHHVVPRKNGGSDQFSNLILLHEHCHYETHINKSAPRKTPTDEAGRAT